MSNQVYLSKIIQFDDVNWRILGVGVENEKGVYCHLAAVYQFQKDGKTPVQIADFVPKSILKRARTL